MNVYIIYIYIYIKYIQVVFIQCCGAGAVVVADIILRPGARAEIIFIQ